MRRLVAAGAALALLGTSCGSGGGDSDAAPAGPRQFGEGVVVQDGEPTPTTAGSDTPGVDETVPPGAVAQGEAPASHHPRDASGNYVANVTVREQDGLFLQLTVDQATGYEGDLIFDLVVENRRDAPVYYDFRPADAAVIRDEGGATRWSSSRCNVGEQQTGYRALEPGETTRLTYQYDADGGSGGAGCVLGDGRYEVTAQFVFCGPDRYSGGECTGVSSVVSHPVAIRLEGT